MGGLFDHARKFLRGFSAPIVASTQRFSVACPHGHRLAGVRTEGYQALRCPTCGEGIFVLPRSPLPEPSEQAPLRPEARSSRGSAPSDGPVALTDPVLAREIERRVVEDDEPEELAEIEWVDEAAETPAPPPATHKPWPDPGQLALEEIADAQQPAPAAETRPPEARRPAPASRPAGNKPARPRARPAVDADPYAGPAASADSTRRAVVVAPRLTVRERVARHRNSLIFSGVALIVVATVAYRIHRQRMLTLPRVAELGWTEGLAALDAGRFDAARQVLSDARDAVDSLGDHSERAGAIRQGALEIAVLTRLSPEPLETLLEQAAQSDAKQWAEQFRRLYAGRTIVIETDVVATPDTRGEGDYDLAYRIFRPGEGDRPPSVGRISLRGFKLFEVLKPKVGDHLTFGAALASFEFDLKGDEWRVGLVPDSGVTMLHRRALETLGWPTAETPAEEAQP